MDQQLQQHAEHLQWQWPKESSYFSSTTKLLFFGSLPTLNTGLALAYAQHSSWIYLVGKMTMIFLAWPFLSDLFQFRSTKKQLKKFTIWTSILALAPIAFIFTVPPSSLGLDGIQSHLQDHQLQSILLPLILGLCFFNSALEEIYFRGFLMKDAKDQLSSLAWLSFLFMPHHFFILSQFFDLSFALLFTLGTGIAALVWNKLRFSGMPLSQLWISHLILDIVVILIPAITFGLL